MTDWNEQFLDLFERFAAKFHKGARDYHSYYDQRDLAFLGAIGHKPREFFDFVEDYCGEGSPPISTALLVASVRRDYFLHIQGGMESGRVLTREDCPGFGEELEGIAYLPRLIAKGRAKLKGELDPDLMFCCGGDRNFFRKHGNIHPADFLRHIWDAGENDQKIVAWVNRISPLAGK